MPHRVSTRLIQSIRPHGWLLAALSIGLVLRLIGLTSHAMWYDEAFSVLFSKTGLKAMAYGTLTPVNGAAADIHPLLYYTVLWGWMKLVGTSALAVRSLSVVIGLGVVLAGWRLSADLFDREVANLAAILLAVSPFEIHYAQEARMYSLLAMLCLFVALFYYRGIMNGHWRDWIGFGICAALAMYAHILAAGVLLALGFSWFLWHRGQRTKQFTTGVGLALLIYLPWMVQLPSQMSRVELSYWIESPGALDLVQAAIIFVTDLPLKDILLPVGLFIAILTLSLAAWQTYRASRDRSPQFHCASWVSFLALAPPVLIYAVSQIQPVFILRGLLPSVSFFLIWLAWALRATRRNRLIYLTGMLAMLVASFAGLVSRWDYQGFPYAPFAEVAAEIESQLEAGEVVLHSNKLSMLPMVYAAPQLDQRYMADRSGSGSDTLALPTQEVLDLFAYEQIELAAEGAGRVYFIIFEREIAEYLAAGFAEHPYLTWLESRFEVAEMRQWGELRLYVFE